MIGGLLYDDETRALKMIDEPPSHNLGHDLIRVRPWNRSAKASAFAKSSREAGVSRSAGAVMCSLSSVILR
jgi:hypothetical protein